MYKYAVETKNLTKKYENDSSICDINLHVPKGKIYGMLGCNGAGKTTTMKMLLNLTVPTSGSIYLFGKKADGKECKLYYRIGSLIESPGFYGNLTARENLTILARLRGQHRRDTIESALRAVGLDTMPTKIFREFSLGMKQRLGIAAAVMHEPELLILDEPINGLDPIGIHEIRSYLLKLCREKGTTILISSHVLSEVGQIADIIGLMHEGKLIEESDMAVLREHNRKYAEFEVSDINAAVLVLERDYHIKEYMVAGTNLIRIFEQIDNRAHMNASFVQHGIVVARINICEETLEDYVTKRIGGGGIGSHLVL